MIQRAPADIQLENDNYQERAARGAAVDAESDRFDDDLQLLIDALPTLDEPTREKILRIASAQEERPEDVDQ